MPWQDSDGSQHSSSPDWRGKPSSGSQWVEPPKPATPPPNIYEPTPNPVYHRPDDNSGVYGYGYQPGGLTLDSPIVKAFVFIVKWASIITGSAAVIFVTLALVYTALDSHWRAKNASGSMVFSSTEFELRTFIPRLRGKKAFLAGDHVIVNADVKNLDLYSYKDMTINGNISGSRVSSTLGTLTVNNAQNSTLEAHRIVVNGNATNTKQVVFPQLRQLPKAIR